MHIQQQKQEQGDIYRVEENDKCVYKGKNDCIVVNVVCLTSTLLGGDCVVVNMYL